MVTAGERERWWPMPVDLFGEDRPPERKRKGPRPNGYAWKPGTGPKGETCGSCKHHVRRRYTSKTYFKCLLMREHWKASRTSDILVRSPACKFWEAREQ